MTRICSSEPFLISSRRMRVSLVSTSGRAPFRAAFCTSSRGSVLSSRSKHSISSRLAFLQPGRVVDQDLGECIPARVGHDGDCSSRRVEARNARARVSSSVRRTLRRDVTPIVNVIGAKAKTLAVRTRTRSGTPRKQSRSEHAIAAAAEACRPRKNVRARNSFAYSGLAGVRSFSRSGERRGHADLDLHVHAPGIDREAEEVGTRGIARRGLGRLSRGLPE